MVEKNKKKSLNFFPLFICSLIFELSFYSNYFFLILLIPICYYLFLTNVKIKDIILIFLFGFFPCITNIFIKNFNVYDWLYKLILDVTHFDLKENIKCYFEKLYSEKESNFLKLLILNIKNDQGYDIYKQMINLSIVYLIVISGFHISFIQLVINKIFKKLKKLGFIFNILLTSVYSWILNFSVSINRCFFSLLFHKKISKISSDNFDTTSLVGYLNLLIVPQSYSNIGFQLSYLCTLGILFLNKFDIKNIFINRISINYIALLISFPIVLSLNQKISVFALINSFIFSTFFIFSFCVLLFICFVPFLSFLSCFLINIIYETINVFDYLNINLELSIMNVYVSVMFYFVIGLFGIFLYKKYNII